MRPRPGPGGVARAGRAAKGIAATSRVALDIAKDARLDRVQLGSTVETLLPDYVVSADVDVVVLGSQGRSGLARALLGSTAENFLHTLDCDTRVVRGS